jgi:hypothetical protein
MCQWANELLILFYAQIVTDIALCLRTYFNALKCGENKNIFLILDDSAEK